MDRRDKFEGEIYDIDVTSEFGEMEQIDSPLP